LVVSGVPWPAEALAAMPRAVRAVMHSTVTLPSQEVAAWVSARLGDASAESGERALARVRATLVRLHASFNEPLRRDDLAREASVDADRLTRTFREVMGVAPRTYLTRLRVHHAMRLLRTTDLSVTDIGARVGWHDPAHFSTAFRRATGRSPRAFRKEAWGGRG
jgi:transcriptional regulator GlxA family with amidase domain